MGSVLPISTLILLLLSHILLSLVLPVKSEDVWGWIEDTSEIADQYDEDKVHPHTEAEIQAIVAKHNERRLGVSPSASNMQIMVCRGCQHFKRNEI